LNYNCRTIYLNNSVGYFGQLTINAGGSEHTAIELINSTLSSIETITIDDVAEWITMVNSNLTAYDIHIANTRRAGTFVHSQCLTSVNITGGANSPTGVKAMNVFGGYVRLNYLKEDLMELGKPFINISAGGTVFCEQGVSWVSAEKVLIKSGSNFITE
jgi:hypothetical protein